MERAAASVEVRRVRFEAAGVRVVEMILDGDHPLGADGTSEEMVFHPFHFGVVGDQTGDVALQIAIGEMGVRHAPRVADPKWTVAVSSGRAEVLVLLTTLPVCRMLVESVRVTGRSSEEEMYAS